MIENSSPRGTILALPGTSLSKTTSTALLSSHPAISFFTASTHLRQSDLTKASKKFLGSCFISFDSCIALSPTSSIAITSSGFHFLFSTWRSRSFTWFSDLSSNQVTVAMPLPEIAFTVPNTLSGYSFEYDPGSLSKISAATETRSPTMATFLPFPFRLGRWLALLLDFLTFGPLLVGIGESKNWSACGWISEFSEISSRSTSISNASGSFTHLLPSSMMLRFEIPSRVFRCFPFESSPWRISFVVSRIAFMSASFIVWPWLLCSSTSCASWSTGVCTTLS